MKPKVSDLERQRVKRLADELLPDLVAGIAKRRVYSVAVADLEDVDLWRRAARKVARDAGIPIRTGFSPDGERLWVIDNRPVTELEQQVTAKRLDDLYRRSR